MRLGSRWGVVLLLVAGRCFGATETISTTYQYNADGALAAVRTQVDGAPAATRYLTWDNFTPDAAAPASGTVSTGDGNLLGVGASPGRSGQLTYDVRDRLTGCAPPGRSAVRYTYHPASLMASSTLASGDALQFYYDTAAAPRMINTRQPSTGLAASFLGPVRYLSDGTEQVLLSPRKDVAGLYDASAQTLSPYRYDPYGGLGTSGAATDRLTSVPPAADPTAHYDLRENPFQYAREYRDPTCDTYYLRARWYLPSEQTFLSRDPADWVHRYSYTAGNPVGRSDPSGLKYTGADFSRDVDQAVHKLTPGIWAYVEPVLPVWGQVLGGVELVGLLPSFFHRPTTQGYVTFGFLAASIVAEAGSELTAFDRLAPFVSDSDRAFGARMGIDLTLGGSQTVAQSYRHGRIDVPALIQGTDSTLAGIFWARLGAGIGYRPHNLTADHVEEMAEAFFPADSFFTENQTHHRQALVYLVRSGRPKSYTTPWMEWKTIGRYHEYVVAVTASHQFFLSELSRFPFETEEGASVHGFAIRRSSSNSPVWYANIPQGHSVRFAGAFDLGAVHDVMTKGSPLGMPAESDQRYAAWSTGRATETPYNRYSANCHDHAHGIVSELSARRGSR